MKTCERGESAFVKISIGGKQNRNIIWQLVFFLYSTQIIAVICMICIAPPLTWFSRLFTFVIATAFGITVLLVFSYLVSLKNVIMPKINWLFVVRRLFDVKPPRLFVLMCFSAFLGAHLHIRRGAFVHHHGNPAVGIHGAQ